MRRTQPDFSSVLPTGLCCLVYERDALEKGRSLRAARSLSKRRDRLRLLPVASVFVRLACSDRRSRFSLTRSR
jgi:hypothetical protein